MSNVVTITMDNYSVEPMDFNDLLGRLGVTFQKDIGDLFPSISVELKHLKAAFEEAATDIENKLAQKMDYSCPEDVAKAQRSLVLTQMTIQAIDLLTHQATLGDQEQFNVARPWYGNIRGTEIPLDFSEVINKAFGLNDSADGKHRLLLSHHLSEDIRTQILYNASKKIKTTPSIKNIDTVVTSVKT